jgi:hypothetical protein
MRVSIWPLLQVWSGSKPRSFFERHGFPGFLFVFVRANVPQSFRSLLKFFFRSQKLPRFSIALAAFQPGVPALRQRLTRLNYLESLVAALPR